MKPKTLILMGVAVVCGLAASYMTSKLLGSAKETVLVLKAKEDLRQWAVINNPNEKFEAAENLKSQLPNNAFVLEGDERRRDEQMRELFNRQLRRSLEAGAILSIDDLQPKDKTSLEAQIEKGKRAVSVAISPQSAVGGFVMPGSRVDVIHIPQKGGSMAANDPKVILENVLVRAVDLTPVRPDDRPGIIGGTATLELTPDDVLKLSAIEGNGFLKLALRSPNDDTKMPPKEEKKKEEAADKDDKIAVEPPPPPAAEPAKEPVKPTTGATVAEEDKKKPEETTVAYMTVISGTNIIERAYTMNSKGQVVRSDVKATAEPKPPEVKPADKADTKDGKKATPDDTTSNN